MLFQNVSIASLAVIVVYFILRRQFVQGVAAGSLAGAVQLPACMVPFIRLVALRQIVEQLSTHGGSKAKE